MNGFFYWFGLVMSCLMGLAFVVAICADIVRWFNDLREGRYFSGQGKLRTDSSGRDTASGGTTGEGDQQP